MSGAVSYDRHDSELGSWEMAHAAPAEPLRGWVSSYCGYTENTRGPFRRRELPFAGIPLIISFGDSLAVSGPGAVSSRPTQTSFMAGLSDGPALTEHEGRQAGIQVNLSPLAGHRLLGISMETLTNQVVGLEELLGSAGAELGERLAELPGWSARFAALDLELGSRIEAARPVSPDVVGAWRELSACDGAVAIGDLTVRLGCSRRHLARRFREQVGMTPKAVARVLRFQSVVRAFREGGGESWAEAAQRAGYYDQPHLNREFRELAGLTPEQFRASLLPDSGGVQA